MYLLLEHRFCMPQVIADGINASPHIPKERSIDRISPNWISITSIPECFSFLLSGWQSIAMCRNARSHPKPQNAYKISAKLKV